MSHKKRGNKMIKILAGTGANPPPPPPPPPPPGQLHAPTFTPNGSLISNTNCELNCVDEEAHIFYTLGANPPPPTHVGDAPTGTTQRIGSNDGVVNSGPGQVRFKALAYESGFQDSEIATSDTFGTPITTLKPILSGFSRLLPADLFGNRLPDQTNDIGWQKDYIDAYRYRGTWSALSPNARGVYEWAPLDSLFNLAEQHNKFLEVNISGGKMTPQWVYDQGCTKYLVHDTSAADGVVGPYQPIPWQPLYQTLWFEFLDAFFVRYGSNDRLRAMIDAGFMLEVSMELGDQYDEGVLTQTGFVPMSDPSNLFGFPDVHTAYRTSAKAILDRTFYKFSNIGHVLTATLVWVGDTVGGRNDENDVRDYYQQRNAYQGGSHPEYVGRTGEIITSARGFVPNQGPPDPSNLSAGPQYAQEFRTMTVLVPSKFPNSYYIPGHAPAVYPGPMPCLQDCLEYQYFLGKNLVEVYIGDIQAAGADAIFEIEHPKIVGNLLPPS